MQRRDFLAGIVTGTTAAVTAGCAASVSTIGTSGAAGESGSATASAPQPSGPNAQVTGKPNIIFVMADELRYPMHFPAGITTADEFMAAYMPNVYRHLWQGGVVFANHHTAAGACSPSRGVWLSGLYAQQTWLVTTVGASGNALIPPSLHTAFPTYGQLLRKAGYEVPYIGKAHVASTVPYSNDECGSNAPHASNYLAPYGFDTFVCPDPAGSQGQGAGCDGGCTGDAAVADSAINWLTARAGNPNPFCLTVSFVNPHDQEYFWGGTEPVQYMGLFGAAGKSPLVPYDTSIVSESNPAPQGFPVLPPNWESFDTLSANKPPTQAMFNEGLQATYGATSFDPTATTFSLQPSPILNGKVLKGVAPFSYWQRVQDSYVSIIRMVDQQIGRVLDAIPADIRARSVVLFSADHGEYVGSHGFLQSKVGTVYEECMNVPLVVRDYTGRYAGDVSTKRMQLTSSVDLLRMLVSLGYEGSSSWLTGDLQTLYGNRHDLLAVVKSNAAAGRAAAFYTTDEHIQIYLNYNRSPFHVLGMITPTGKLGVYSYWKPGTTEMAADGQQLEFYDYTAPNGRLELNNQPNAPGAQSMYSQLINQYLASEIQAPMPTSLGPVARQSRQNYLSFVSLVEALTESGALQNIGLFFGADAL